MTLAGIPNMLNLSLLIIRTSYIVAHLRVGSAVMSRHFFGIPSLFSLLLRNKLKRSRIALDG